MHIMMKLINGQLVALVTSLLLLQAPGCATTGNDGAPSRSFLSAQEAAQAGLDVLRNLSQPPIDSEDIRSAQLLGFASLDEIASARLGSPFRICSAPLELLKKYQKGNDPSDFLVDTRHLIFPILVSGRARSSVTVEETEDDKRKNWKVIHRGSPRFMRLMQNAFPDQIVPIQPQNYRRSTFIVSIIGLRFLGDRKDGELVFSATEKIDALELKPGDQLSARAFFDKLSDRTDLKQYGEKYQKYLEKLSGRDERETLTTGGQKC